MKRNIRYFKGKRQRFGIRFSRRPGGQLPRTYLGALWVAGRHDEARELVLRTLRETAVDYTEGGKRLGMGPTRFKEFIQKLGLQGEPARIRAEIKARFRLPPWRGGI